MQPSAKKSTLHQHQQVMKNKTDLKIDRLEGEQSFDL